MASDCSWASKTHYELLKSHTFTIPSSSPLLRRVSFAKWTRWIGLVCAFFIRWATFPELSMKAKRLSSPHVASAIWSNAYYFRKDWTCSGGHWICALLWLWLEEQRHQKNISNYINIEGYIWMCPLIRGAAKTSWWGWKWVFQIWRPYGAK